MRWLLVSMGLLAGATALAAAAPAQERPDRGRDPACVLRVRDPNTVVVSVDPQHSAEARACRRYQAAGGPECRVIAVHVVATGGVAGTTVTGTGKCGDQILQSTATTNVPIPPVTGPTAKGQPADCVASVVQPGGGTIDPTLTYTVTCIFVDP